MASLDHREARRAQVRWARIEGLSPVLPIPRDNLGLGGAGLGFASISLFGRRKQENAGREEAAPAQAVPYSPKRGTYAHDALQRRFKELDKQNAGHISENDLKATGSIREKLASSKASCGTVGMRSWRNVTKKGRPKEGTYQSPGKWKDPRKRKAEVSHALDADWKFQ
ncbi:uncharacterized protein LOC112350711 [Selaginella moellendorffii]|uniref:uncharacterized protein LOC112350711 n=1 Tax=Selaginella moellendorffii TaxID=88036 RepID=UPI000D1C4C9E|nr:uncharacterized protein LOC112350711 [Selaginella moellendorffii]|eukprot:XP_024543174.1 uncharacterized protein LOC112350711 [Selaginella moellendorffii]